MRQRPLALVAIEVLIFGLLLSTPAPAALADPGTQTGQAGQVTIKATWEGPDAGPVFTIVLDTHAVNLDGYDLTQLAVLSTDQGIEVAPSSWDAPPGGHHRQGTLSFPTTTTDGSPAITPETTVLRLSIRDVGGVPETVLQWTLSS
jgi:hypothetical protein